MNGIPEGYEFVRVGRAMAGETVLAASGTPLTLVKDSMMRNCVVIRKVKPNCEFPRGVFKDGWITHDIKGACWWSRKPEWSTTSQQWTGNCCVTEIGKCNSAFRTPVWFHPLIEARLCIQQVGPKYESENP